MHSFIYLTTPWGIGNYVFYKSLIFDEATILFTFYYYVNANNKIVA